METPQGPETEPAIGSRVQIFTVNREHIGFGRYVEEVPVAHALSEIVQASGNELQMDPETKAAFDEMIARGDTTPRIMLESGQILFGFQCWWCAVGEKPDVHAFLESCTGPFGTCAIRSVIRDEENADRFTLDVRFDPILLPESVPEAKGLKDGPIKVIVDWSEATGVLFMGIPIELSRSDWGVFVATAHEINKKSERASSVLVLDPETPRAIVHLAFVIPQSFVETNRDVARSLFLMNISALLGETTIVAAEFMAAISKPPDERVH